VWRARRSVRGSSNSLSPKSMMAIPTNHIMLLVTHVSKPNTSMQRFKAYWHRVRHHRERSDFLYGIRPGC
jgi:hypothetical protein